MTTTIESPTKTALQLLHAPGTVFEIRIIDAPIRGTYRATVAGYFDDPDKAVAAIRQYDGKANIYTNLNPCNPALLARAANRLIQIGKKNPLTSDKDILQRRWLGLDLDYQRPANISASDAELRAALATAAEVEDYLTGLGWPEPVRAMSGNGGHRCYAIDLPNDDDSTALVQNVLNTLALRWPEPVKIDETVFNAARIWKLYGTMAVKGDHIPERPHRRAEIISTPEPVELVTAEMLRVVAPPAAVTISLPPKKTYHSNGNGNGGYYTAEKLEAAMTDQEIGFTRKEKDGRTLYILDRCLTSEAHTDGACISIDADGKTGYKCQHDSCKASDWQAVKPILFPNGTSKTPTPPTDDDGFLLGFSADDEGNAQAVKAVYGGKFLYCEALGWLIYNGRFWEATSAELRLERAIVEVLKARRVAAVKREKYESIVSATRGTTANVRNCKALFKSLVIADINDFDSDPDALNCYNGVVDLRTGQLTPHDPGQFFTYCLSTAYDPNADSNFWEEWLYKVLTPEANQKLGQDDSEYRKILTYIQIATGYSLTGHTVEQVLFYLYGKKGRNGKGVLLQSLLHVLGKPLSIGVDFDIFTKDRSGDSQNFDLAPLRAARFIAASESQEVDRINSKVVKSITGGDPTYCAKKYHDFFSYIPQYKVWLAANYPINADADDDALWARIRVIDFPNCYEGREDKRLLHRMKTEHAAGILAWAIQGAIKWYELHNAGSGLPQLQVIEDTTKEQRSKNDNIQMFLDEWAAMGADDPIAYDINSIPATAYKNWCDENNVKPLGAKRLRAAMERREYVYKNVKTSNFQQKRWVKA